MTTRRAETVATAQMAELLAVPWQKYANLFGQPPHGTEQQIAAMLELVGQRFCVSGSEARVCAARLKATMNRLIEQEAIDFDTITALEELAQAMESLRQEGE